MREYPIAPFRKTDDNAKPTPLADRINISTNSRFLLKYWATINVDVSLVMPTPTPVQANKCNSYMIGISIVILRMWIVFHVFSLQKKSKIILFHTNVHI